MTNVHYSIDKNGFIKKITITGHSNFSNYGNDIVCSSISSICDGAFSFFLSFYSDFFFLERKEGKRPFILFSVIKNNIQVDICLKMIIHQLENISNFYPKNISINRHFFSK